jgi:hypothetical protein
LAESALTIEEVGEFAFAFRLCPAPDTNALESKIRKNGNLLLDLILVGSTRNQPVLLKTYIKVRLAIDTTTINFTHVVNGNTINADTTINFNHAMNADDDPEEKGIDDLHNVALLDSESAVLIHKRYSFQVVANSPCCGKKIVRTPLSEHL